MSAWMDSDGYPTDAALERLKVADAPEAFAILQDAWWFGSGDTPFDQLRPEESAMVRKEWDEPDIKFLRFATGGWSGNEELLEAFSENVVSRMCWKLSAAGGLHIYEVWPDDSLEPITPEETKP